MTLRDAYWVGAPGRGNPHSASVVVNTCSNNVKASEGHLLQELVSGHKG